MADDAQLEFLILGPLEVRAHGRPLELGGPRQRGLLAMLLLHANRVVSRARLIDELWGDRPAADADHALNVQVSRLRKVLGDGDRNGNAVLRTRPPGYLLHVDPGSFDLARFERLRAKAHVARGIEDEKVAASLLRQADALWRGAALADLEDERWARIDSERLQELRLVCIEERIEIELDLGRHGALVGELQALVVAYPLREALCARLMLALYRSGRQAEALETYRRTRDLLVRELGLEPGTGMRELERSILTQVPELHTGRSETVVASADRSGPPHGAPAQATARRRDRPWRLATFLAAVSAAVVALLVLVVPAKRGEAQRLPGAGVVIVAPDGRALSAAVPLALTPTELTSGFGSIWISHSDDGTLTRVDIAERGVRDTIRVGSGPSSLAVAGGAVWVANTLDSTVSRIDPATDEVTQTVAVGRFPAALAAARDAVWVANRGDGTVSRIDPDSGRVVATLQAGRAPSGIAWGHGAVWVTNEDGGTVSRIDPGTNAVTQTIAVGDAPSAVTVTARNVWVMDRLDSTVSRVDPRTQSVTATIAIRGGPSGIAGDGDGVWVTSEHAGTLARIDDVLGAVDRTIDVGDKTAGVTVTPAGIWAATAPGGAAHRGGTLTVVASVDPNSLDPPFAFNSGPLVGVMNDGLVTFNHVSGARGAQLVPDLAQSLPSASADGRAYTFRLRTAIAYSTGGFVRARDVRRSLERLYELRSPARPFYDAIAGARACETRPRHCDLSRGIETNDRAGTVTFRLSSADPDFLSKLALPFAAVLPAATPSRDAAGQAPTDRPPLRLAATGPYMLESYAPGQRIRLVRNPRFREWSHAAQPDGYPDRIGMRLGLKPSRGVGLMRRGEADFMSNIGPPPADQRETLARRYASQLRVNELLATDAFFFNTRVAPFDDIRVRRAVNLAIDRRRLVAIYGGSLTATATCQMLPPQVPGHRTYCPYTRDPRTDGRWRGPDLPRARRLVAASGTSGMKVALWNTRTPQIQYDEGRHVVTVLRRLGYDASYRILPDSSYYAYTNDSRNRAQLITGGWNLDYPSASNMLVRLTCPYFRRASAANIDPTGFCDPAIDRLIRRATTRQSTRPDLAAELWARIDRTLTNRAIWLPTVTPRTTDILSRRAGNYRYHLVLGALIDQLWVR